jgi:hypothetical protein
MMKLNKNTRNRVEIAFTAISQIKQELKRFTFIPILIFLVASCKNTGDPAIEVLASYNLNYNQITGISRSGEYLKDSLSVTVHNLLSPANVANYIVEFEVLTGGGTVDHPRLFTRKDGKASTRWKLGKEYFLQTVEAKIYDPEGLLLSKIRFNAYGMLFNAWNEVSFAPLSTVADAAGDTINQASWLISLSKVYKRGSHFLDWQLINEPKLNGAREIEIDKNGVIYIGTWFGELYKSADQGQSWIKCTNPIPNHPYYCYFWITGNGELWATHSDRGTWFSKDGGNTWTNSGTEFITGAYKLKNGSLLSLISPQGISMVLMKSDNDGKTWSTLNTPTYPYCYFVTDNDEIIVCTQGMSVGIHKSTDLGKTYKLVHSVPVTFGTGSQQTYFHKFGSDYYMVVPGYGILKTSNFEQFQTIFNQPNVNGLYLDHAGSLIVTGTLEKRNKTFFNGKE